MPVEHPLYLLIVILACAAFMATMIYVDRKTAEARKRDGLS